MIRAFILIFTADSYLPDDLVTWELSNGAPHIGILVDTRSALTRRHMMIHNIGQGPKLEDVLFDWKITGHFPYFGPHT